MVQRLRYELTGQEKFACLRGLIFQVDVLRYTGAGFLPKIGGSGHSLRSDRLARHPPSSVVHFGNCQGMFQIAW